MPKRNIYFNDEDVKDWDNLPSGERSKLLQFALSQASKKAAEAEKTDPLYRWLYEYETQLQESQKMYNKYYEYEFKHSVCQERLEEIASQIIGKNPEINLDSSTHNCFEEPNQLKPEIFVNTIIQQAKLYAESKTIIKDPGTSEEYIIEEVDEDNIYINKLSLNSNKLLTMSTKKIANIGENMNGKSPSFIRLNQFSNSHIARVIIVELHPNLQSKSDWVIANWN